MHLFVAVSRYFGFLALRLYAPGTLSENAFHTSISGQSTAMNDTYRRVWRTGQVIGWTVVVLIVLAVVALVTAFV
jgi:ABC-type multidrug transport system permease subunit